MKISVIGSGGWGTALAILLESNGHDVTIWSRKKSTCDELEEKRENSAYLPGVKIPNGIKFSNDLLDTASSAEAIVVAVPSHTIREYAKKIADCVKEKLIINCTKGLEEKSLKTISSCIKEEIPSSRICVLSGPSHAEEVARFIPTAVVAAADDISDAQAVQNIFMNDSFRVYTSTDVLGVEVGAAFKNVIALCAGMVDGIGYGDNTKAALLTRGLAEITRLGVALGAKTETFNGLTGIGDLIVTCTSMHSRNRRAGILLGQGKSLEETVEEIHMVTEGITCAAAAYELSGKTGVEMPIVREAYRVLYEGKNAKQAVTELMQRDKKEENF